MLLSTTKRPEPARIAEPEPAPAVSPEPAVAEPPKPEPVATELEPADIPSEPVAPANQETAADDNVRTFVPRTARWLVVDPVDTIDEASETQEAAELPAMAPSDTERLAALEARTEQLDAALRRVLTLLVDWVETDARAPERAVATAPEFAPIRGAAAWDDAA